MKQKTTARLMNKTKKQNKKTHKIAYELILIN